MCRGGGGGGGLGATSPHKPACKNCASLPAASSYIHSLVILSSSTNLCVSLPVTSDWNSLWPFPRSVVPFSLTAGLQLHPQYSAPWIPSSHTVSRVVSYWLAGWLWWLQESIVKKSSLPPILPPMHVQNICRYKYTRSKGTLIHGTSCLVLFSVRGNMKISSEHLGSLTF